MLGAGRDAGAGRRAGRGGRREGCGVRRARGAGGGGRSADAFYPFCKVGKKETYMCAPFSFTSSRTPLARRAACGVRWVLSTPYGLIKEGGHSHTTTVYCVMFKAACTVNGISLYYLLYLVI